MPHVKSRLSFSRVNHNQLHRSAIYGALASSARRRDDAHDTRNPLQVAPSIAPELADKVWKGRAAENMSTPSLRVIAVLDHQTTVRLGDVLQCETSLLIENMLRKRKRTKGEYTHKNVHEKSDAPVTCTKTKWCLRAVMSELIAKLHEGAHGKV